MWLSVSVLLVESQEVTHFGGCRVDRWGMREGDYVNVLLRVMRMIGMIRRRKVEVRRRRSRYGVKMSRVRRRQMW